MSPLPREDTASIDAQAVQRHYAPAAIFWLGAALVVVAGFLLSPASPQRPTPSAGIDASLIWLVGSAIALCALAIAEGYVHRRRRFRLLRTCPGQLLAEAPQWPGVSPSGAATGIAIVLLSCWQFVTPAQVDTGAYRWQALITSIAAIGASAATFTFVHRRWSRGVADVAAGLLTVGIAALALCFIPSEPAELTARFPIVFNTLITALAIMTLFWNWIHRVWTQQLDDGRPWTTAGRLNGLTGRFAFTCAVVAVMLAALMTAWPRLPIVPYRDVSLGRVTYGVAGHLLLILALLRSRRRWQRSSFAVLAVFAVLSLLGFVIVRVSDFVTVAI